MLGDLTRTGCVRTILIVASEQLKHHVMARLFPGFVTRSLPPHHRYPRTLRGVAGHDRWRLRSSSATRDATALCSSASRPSARQLSPVFDGGWTQVLKHVDELRSDGTHGSVAILRNVLSMPKARTASTLKWFVRTPIGMVDAVGGVVSAALARAAALRRPGVHRRLRTRTPGKLRRARSIWPPERLLRSLYSTGERRRTAGRVAGAAHRRPRLAGPVVNR